MKKILLIIFILTLYFANAKTDTILFLGDSLTEGLGVNKNDSFPNLVHTMIQTKLKKTVNIINGGVSGSTTSDGLSRLKWYLRKKPDLIFIALGANDGLRGLDLKQSKKNLEKIIQLSLKSNAKVLLAGMLIPPNYGIKYSKEFENMYKELKEKYKLKTMPFLLDGVAGEKDLNQKDGIHPNKKGHMHIAKNVFEFIKEDL